MRFLTLAALLCAASTTHAKEPVPCEGAEALNRMVSMTIDGMQAFSAACQNDPSAEPCMAFNLAILKSADTLHPGDAERIKPFEEWIGKQCPELAGKFGR